MSTAVGNGTAVDLTKDAPESVTVDVRDPQGAVTGSVELPGAIFGVQVNVPLIHQVVVAQLAAARQGTHDTKTRGEVRGGGRKPYRQKGTGRARQGSTRAPQFTGGGVVHGPTPRSYAQRTPKKMIAAALRGALSDRARNGRIHVLSSVVDGDSPSTKAAVAALTHVSERRHLLLVVERADNVALKSLRNVDRVHVLVADQLNTYDVLVSDDVVFTRGALDAFIAGRPKGKAAKAVATESEVDLSKTVQSDVEQSDVEQSDVEQSEVEQAGVELSKHEQPEVEHNSEEAAQ
jgi:large subunit ribosomal protein L4